MQFHFRHGFPRGMPGMPGPQRPPQQKQPLKRFCKDCDAIVSHPAERCGRCNKIQDGIAKWKREMWLLYDNDWVKYSYLEKSQELKREFIKTSLK
jgi:hypothetical protein